MVLLLLLGGEQTTGLDQGSTQRLSPHPCQHLYELPDLTFNLISHQPDGRLLTQLLRPRRAFLFSIPLSPDSAQKQHHTVVVVTAVMEKLRASF